MAMKESPSAGPERVEAVARHHRVGREPQPHHARALVRPRLHGREICVADPERGAPTLADREGERRLAEHGSLEAFVEHHPEREPTGEAHPDCAHSRTATVLVGVRGEGAQPGGDRARTIERPCGEVTRHASRRERAQHVGNAHRSPGGAEQRRHPHVEAAVDDPLPEADDAGMEPGHLTDDDDGRAGAGAEHGSGPAVVGEGRLGETVERGAVVGHGNAPHSLLASDLGRADVVQRTGSGLGEESEQQHCRNDRRDPAEGDGGSETAHGVA